MCLSSPAQRASAFRPNARAFTPFVPHSYRLLVDLRALEEIVEREHPDLIESADPYQIGWRARRIGRALRIPVLGFYHSHFAEAHIRGVTRFFGDAAMRWARRYVRNLYNSYQATLVPSAGLAAELLKWGVRDVRAVALGINTNIFAPVPDDVRATRASFGVPDSRTLLLYVGRLSPEKNTLSLFRAFEILNEHAPERFIAQPSCSCIQERRKRLDWWRWKVRPAALPWWVCAGATWTKLSGTIKATGLRNRLRNRWRRQLKSRSVAISISSEEVRPRQ